MISSNKRYDGLHCCGEYLLCAYVDDDYLSGWRSEWGDGGAYGVDKMWTAHPGWGDSTPPAAKDRANWDYFKSVYPGFKIDVFYKGESVGTFDLNDVHSPIYYDKLIASWVWFLLAAYPGVEYKIGNAPWVMEGPPKCGSSKLLIPYDGGITTCIGWETSRRIF